MKSLYDQVTPTRFKWKVEQWQGDTYLMGTEWPVKIEHLERLAGKMILDSGEWRELKTRAYKLPNHDSGEPERLR